MVRKYKPIRRRMIWIDDKIRSRRQLGACVTLWNSKSLAQAYSEEYESVSSKTIQRDVAYMRTEGAPIEYDTVNQGYYYTEENYQLPAIRLTESELLFMCLGRDALKQYENTPLYDKLLSVFAKIEDSLPDNISVAPQWLNSRIQFLDAPPRVVSMATWETISKALYRTRAVTIHHRRVDTGRTARRTIHPYGLVSYRGDWYTVAYCTKREAMRTFAISRITAAEMRQHRYEIPEDFDLAEYFSNHIGIIRGGTSQKVRIRFSKEAAPYIAERQWMPGQVLKQKRDGSVEVGFEIGHLDEVLDWVLSWGDRARVLAPKALVDRAAATLKRAADAYR